MLSNNNNNNNNNKEFMEALKYQVKLENTNRKGLES